VAEGHIVSKWSAEVSPENVLPDYPRPQMQRKAWLNLNGLWNYSISPAYQAKNLQFDQQILVPFAIESALSGVKKRISDQEKIWYKRNFEVPADWEGQQILLHFGAVDWEAKVWVNGQFVGQHQGGYDPFSFNITDALVADVPQEIIVSAWDPTSNGTQARGKQITEPRGIWYTPVSGIWQTVWLEPVPEFRINHLTITPDIDQNKVSIDVSSNQYPLANYSIRATVSDGAGNEFSIANTEWPRLEINIPSPKLWSPDNPFLYDLKIQVLDGQEVIDEVDSYFAMRKFSKAKDENGFDRFQLNNEFIFPYGTLDQGWWPDGLYTAPTDGALKYDIQVTKDAGFNTIRKHVKVEPARWYYHCDQIGMMVWQDMPNGDKNGPWRGPSGYDGRQMERNAQSANQFYTEWNSIMQANINKPSIVMWVPFNEGWGQFDTEKVINWTMEADPTRLVNGPSGGNFFPVGHTVDYHRYPGPAMPNLEEHAPNIMKDRVWLLGEFGGLGLPMEGHLWQKDKNWGYRKYGSQAELVQNYKKLIAQMPALQKTGMSAAIYTQTTDVEGEINGLMTYDRAIFKMPIEEVKKINSVLYQKSIFKK
ncbi:MAG: sugar-binding domain-containing protein, partial [Bacteroidota bacterium]